jgi:short-subunit dehydrogenase
MELRGKSVLLTGATGGLGQAIARRLKVEGCRLILTGRRVDVLEALAAEVDGRALAADLSNSDDVDRVSRECGDVDVVVANAALPGNGPLEEYSVEQIDRVIGVNLRSVIVLARVIGEHMLERGNGHFVFVSSLSGKSTTPVTSLYNATKFGLRGFSLALRADWEPRGVGVSCINPGPIGKAGMFVDGGGTLPSGIKPRSPEDVAAAVVKAVVSNKAEIDVADLATRVGATIGLLAPQTAARLGKLVGAEKLARQLAEGNKDKR